MTILYFAKKEGFDFKTWSESQRATVASPVYNAVMQCSNIFDVCSVGWEMYILRHGIATAPMV